MRKMVDGRRRLMATALVASLVLGGAAVAAGGPASASAVAGPVAGYGFVWANAPHATLYTPSTAYQANSTGTLNYIRHDTGHAGGAGQYTVIMPGLGAAASGGGAGYGGNVQVTAYGGGQERCKVEHWVPSGRDLHIKVRCHDAFGVPVDALFSAFYHHSKALQPRQAGYVWADQPTAAWYTPNLLYQANSKGGTNTVHRIGVGRYRVSFAGFTRVGGDVQVTAYGPTSEHCKVVFWGVSTVDVACYRANGSPADSRFSVLYTDQGTPTAPGLHGAYLWANQPTSAAWYAASSTYRWSSASSIWARRTGPGAYEVLLSGQPASGDTNVIATAYGDDNRTCNVSHWVASGSSTLVRLRCRQPGGVPADARFTLLFTTNRPVH